MSFIVLSMGNVSVSLNMLESKVSAPTVLLDIIMILTLINVYANLDTNKSEVSVILSAPMIKHMSTENASVTTDSLSSKENVFLLEFAP